MNYFKRTISIVIMLLLFLSSAAPGYARTKKAKIYVPYWASDHIIAHSAGKTSGFTRTNSMEALDNACASKFKTIELDFSITSDDELVCLHDWKNFGQVTDLSTFISTKINDVLTPLTAATALKMLSDSGKYLVIDAKSKPEYKVYRKVIELCDSLGIPEYKKRIIPQMYSKADYKRYKRIYNFKSGIYTLYKTKNLTKKKLRRIARFCRQKHLVLTISRKRYTKKRAKTLRRYRVPVGVHTVNSKRMYKKFRKRGACVVYTDRVPW